MWKWFSPPAHSARLPNNIVPRAVVIGTPKPASPSPIVEPLGNVSLPFAANSHIWVLLLVIILTGFALVLFRFI